MENDGCVTGLGVCEGGVVGVVGREEGWWEDEWGWLGRRGAGEVE